MAAEIDGAADRIGKSVLIWISWPHRPCTNVAAPALAGDEFEGEALVGRQRDMHGGAAPAFGDGGAHHRLEPVGRDGEAVLEGVDPCQSGPVPGNKAPIRARTGS